MTPGGGAGAVSPPGAADGSGGGPVLGVGVDLVHVPTFVDQLDLPGTRFADVFTPGERRDAAERAEQHGGGEGRHLAARWAAKEALVKAWSASLFGEPPPLGYEVLGLVEVVCDAWGRPRLRLHGAVAEHLAGLAAHVSLSHDGDHATAFVVLARD